MEHCHRHQQGKEFSGDQTGGLIDAETDNGAANFCTLCSISFVGQRELHWHMEKDHGHTSQQEPKIEKNPVTMKQQRFQCPDCGKCYGVIGHLLNHQRSHQQASKSLFKDLDQLKKKAFQCESCGRSYSRASALDAHRRCHEENLVKSRSKTSGEAPNTEDSEAEPKTTENQTNVSPAKLFSCACGKTFSAMMRLKTHQRFSRNNKCTPEGLPEKPKKIGGFHCSECDKSFNGHIAYFNHQRWHDNHSDDSAKRFACEECGKTFMSLTFYDRHQRMAHSDEAPSKSFLHQVCQIQKKSFECPDCGLKFSRASALQSHRLHHTDVFRETEYKLQMGSSPIPQQNIVGTIKTEKKPMEHKIVFSPTSVPEDLPANDTDEEVASYEPGDFNVHVISASESEEEPVQDLNPDLELLCESDQDDGDPLFPPYGTVSKPGMDLKIVKLDFGLADLQCASVAEETEHDTTEERFDCPDCYRWFSSASSLRVHRMWHDIRTRRQRTQGQSVAVYICDACGHETSSYAAHCSHMQEHGNVNADEILNQKDETDKKKLTCDDCGKCFSRLSALVAHQLHHPKRKRYQCPDCMLSYSHAATLYNHMKTCASQKKENVSLTKKEYNPTKTLLGPKMYHCEQCGKGFWSLGAYSHHKQSPSQCTDLRLRKGLTGSLHSVNGHSRSSMKVACPVCGRKFRHKGIMSLHMRKHENGDHKCELCNRSFRLFSSLLRHQVVHSDQLLPPPIKSFQHQVEQLKKNTYSCPDCGKLFSRAKALQFHMKSHGYETGYSLTSPRSTVKLEDLQCATCLAHFNSKASLRAHQKLCIKREPPCKAVCGESDDTSNLHELRMDVSTQDCSSESIKAEVNEEVTVDLKIKKQVAVGSLKQRANDLKYKCKKCDRRFSVVGALNFHKRIHVDGYKSVTKPKGPMSVLLNKSKADESDKGLFRCSECGRRFMSNSALGSHKRWHKEKTFPPEIDKDEDLESLSQKSEGGRHECNKCGKPFFNLCVLHRHQLFNPQCQNKLKSEPKLFKPEESRDTVGSQNQEFSCSECNKTFVQVSLLTAHRENEHSIAFRAADDQKKVPAAVGQVVQEVAKVGRSVPTSASRKLHAHQCPICSMTFAKARGLRAHNWQVHSKKTKGKKKVSLRAVKEPVKAVNGQAVGDSSISNSPLEIRKKVIKSDPLPVPEASISEVKVQSTLPGVLPHQKILPLEVKQEQCEQETSSPESTAEVAVPRGLELHGTVKYLFKCNKCGKAFLTEEHREAHKAKAKSRPFCCALCCQGFWTESQLKQHLTWHDEVRGRLPNEVRFRLRAALSQQPLKPTMPSDNSRAKPPPPSSRSQDSQAQSSHRCQHCGKAFLSLVALQKHETRHSSNDSYHCSVCPRTFSEIQDLIDHHQECIGNFKQIE